MNRFPAFALLFALLLAPCAPPPASAAPGPVLLELPGSALRYVVVSFRTGSADDPHGREGLAAVCAELVGRSVERALATRAADTGARFSWHADLERVTFRLKCHRDTFDEAWRVVAPLLVRPEPNGRAVIPAVAAMRSRREATLENGEALAKTALACLAFRGHPYGHPVFGTAAGLAAIGPADCRRFLRERFSRARLELAVAADRPEPFAVEVDRSLANLPPGKPLPEGFPPAPAPPAGLRVLLVRRQLPTSAVSFGFPHGATRAAPDYPALLAANAGFGQHRCLTGQLFRELRAVRGFNYGNYAYLEHFVEGAQDKMPQTNVPMTHPFFSIWIRNLDDRNAVFALKFALRALADLPDAASSEPRFTESREFIGNYLRLYAFDPFQKLGFRMDDAVFGAPDFFRALPERLARLTPGEVRRAVAERLAAPPGAFAAIATSDPEAMRARLLGKVPADPFYRTAIPPEAAEADERAKKFDLKLSPAAIETVDATELF